MGADVHYSAEELLAQAGWLGALARTLVADPGEADDLVQETWLAALKRPPMGDRPLRPWLARVARNLARMRRRSEGARGERERSAGRVDREQPTSAELAERLEGQTLLVQALAELDEPYRSTVLLAYFEQASSAEIAARDGISEGTVRWRLHQAIRELRTRLDDRHANDRSAWVALLLPLARTESSALATASGAAGGVLGMSLYLKLSTVAVFVFLIAWFSFRALRPDAAELADARVQSTESVVFAPLEEAPATLVAEVPGSARSAAGAAAPGASGAAPAREPLARLRLRVLDEQHQPIAGVPIEARSSAYFRAQSATSGADGRAELELQANEGLRANPEAQLELELVTRAPQWTIGRLRPLVHAGESADLGDLVLQRAGAVRGRVVDAAGAPIEGATIALRTDDVLVPGSAQGIEISDLEGLPGPSTHSDARGEFLLASVPPGLRRIGSSLEDFITVSSGFVEVRAGLESRIEALVLLELPQDALIRGRVLDPHGAPVAWAEVGYHVRRFGSSGNGGTATDAQGRFRILAPEGGRFSLCVRARDQALGLALVEDVQPGNPERVVHLPEARPLELRVHDREGRPVESFYASLERGEQWLERTNTLAHPGGVARFRLPPLAFSLRVRAEGYQELELEDLDPSRSALLELSLDALPGVRGRVSADGAPVAGATVEVWEEARQTSEIDGFPVRVESELLASATSAGDGSFSLTLRRAGRYFLRAAARGRAPAEIGPLEIDPGHGRADLELALPRGGSVEGRVLVDTSRSAAGQVVAFSRGDGHAFTVRTDESGSFRAEGLMPGRWLVAQAAHELVPGRHSSSSSPGPVGEIPSNCEVVEGRATRVEIDLRAAPGDHLVVRGLLRTPGVELGVWQAQLVAAASGLRAASASGTQLTADGSFELDAPATPRRRIVLRALEGAWSGLTLVGEIDPGARSLEWTHELQGGELVVRGAVPEGHTLAALWTDGQGKLAFALLRPAPGSNEVRARMPAGKLRVVDAQKVDGPEQALALPALAQGELLAGGSTTLSIP